MTINSEAVLTVLAVNEKPSSDRKSTYYDLAVMSGGEVANVSCTREAYDGVKATWDPAVPMKPYRFLIINNVGKYEYMRIANVLPDNPDTTQIGTGQNVSTKSAPAGSGTAEKATTEKPAK